MEAAARKRVGLRMRDVAVALATIGAQGHSPGKLHLQKFIYLLDALSFLFRILPPKQGHRTYKRGPWDPAIQNAVDCLMFRGLVRVDNMRQLKSGEIAVSYKLTSPGEHWVQQLRQSGRFGDRFRAAEEIAMRVSRLGWGRIKELVYAEPTYVARREEGFGQELAPAEEFDASTRALISVIQQALESGWPDFIADERYVTDIFFRFLDEYAQRRRQQERGNTL